MADWGNLQQGLVSGFEVGQKTGGKLAGIGSVLSKIADKLRADRQQQEALNLLGQTEMMKATIAESNPKTKAEIDKEKAMASYYNSLSKQLDAGGLGQISQSNGETDVSNLSAYGIPEDQSEDYYMKP